MIIRIILQPSYIISDICLELTVFLKLKPPKSMNFFLLEALEAGLAPPLEAGIDIVFFTGTTFTLGTAAESIDILLTLCGYYIVRILILVRSKLFSLEARGQWKVYYQKNNMRKN